MASKEHHRSFDMALKLEAVEFAVKKGKEAAAREWGPVIGEELNLETEESNDFAVAVRKDGEMCRSANGHDGLSQVNAQLLWSSHMILFYPPALIEIGV